MSADCWAPTIGITIQTFWRVKNGFIFRSFQLLSQLIVNMQVTFHIVQTAIKCLARKNTIDLHWKLYLWQQIFSMYGSILRKKNESLEPRTTQLLPYWFLLSRIFSFLLPFFLIGGVSTCTASIFAHWKERGRCLVRGKIRREIYKFKRNIAQEALAKSQRCYHNAQWTFRWIH